MQGERNGKTGKLCFSRLDTAEPQLILYKDNANERQKSLLLFVRVQLILYKDKKTRPISDGLRKNNVNYWVFRDICSIIPHS